MKKKTDSAIHLITKERDELKAELGMPMLFCMAFVGIQFFFVFVCLVALKRSIESPVKTVSSSPEPAIKRLQKIVADVKGERDDVRNQLAEVKGELAKIKSEPSQLTVRRLQQIIVEMKTERDDYKNQLDAIKGNVVPSEPELFEEITIDEHLKNLLDTPSKLLVTPKKEP